MSTDVRRDRRYMAYDHLVTEIGQLRETLREMERYASSLDEVVRLLEYTVPRATFDDIGDDAQFRGYIAEAVQKAVDRAFVQRSIPMEGNDATDSTD